MSLHGPRSFYGQVCHRGGLFRNFVLLALDPCRDRVSIFNGATVDPAERTRGVISEGADGVPSQALSVQYPGGLGMKCFQEQWLREL